MGALVRTVRAVLDPIAEAGHGNAQLSAQAIVLVRLTSLGLTLRAWGADVKVNITKLVKAAVAGRLLPGRGRGRELRLGFRTSAFLRS